MTRLSVGQLLDLAEVESAAEIEERSNQLSTTALAAQGRGKDIKKRLRDLERAQRGR